MVCFSLRKFQNILPKSRAVRKGADCYHLLYAFDMDALSNEMIADAEKFLLLCITKHDVDTFNELRLLSIDSKSTIELFLQTSDNIRQHILRAYLQCYIWLHYAFLENIDLDPLEYGYRLTETATLPQSYQLNRQFPATFLSHATTKNAAKSVSANVGYWKFVAASSVNLMQVLGVRTL